MSSLIVLDLDKEQPPERVLVVDVVSDAHTTAVASGWWEGVPDADRLFPSPERLLSKLMLITTEVAEAAECVRLGNPLYWVDEANDKPEGLLSELADIVIRIGDLVGSMEVGPEFEEAIRAKLAYNKTRSHRHGGKLA